jgi:transcriptional regulator with XRE-family HTH domain
VNITAKIEINEHNIDKLAKNMRSLLDEHRVTENEVAQSLNIPVMTIRRLVSGETTDPRISTLKLIADHFNISVDSLLEDNTSRSMVLMSKTTPQFVPILDWKTATTITSIGNIDLKAWKEWHPIVLAEQTLLSNNAFALESRPSMQPRFPVGTLFIIDPNEVPNDGDIVLIKMKRDGNLSLRELIIDLPRWQLQPIVLGSETLFYDEQQHHMMGIVMLTFLYARKEK